MTMCTLSSIHDSQENIYLQDLPAISSNFLENYFLYTTCAVMSVGTSILLLRHIVFSTRVKYTKTLHNVLCRLQSVIHFIQTARMLLIQRV